MTTPLTPTRVLPPATPAKAVKAGPASLVMGLEVLAGQIGKYLEVREQEATARRRIQAWEATQLAEIHARTQILREAIGHVFSERHTVLTGLLDSVTKATYEANNDHLPPLLAQLSTVLATDPFQDIADLAELRLRLDDPDTIFQL